MWEPKWHNQPLFSGLSCGDRTRGNGQRLEHRKFCIKMQRNFFTVRVMEHWNRLPRGVVDSSSLEIFKAHLDTYLCSLLEGGLLCRGLDSVIPGGPSQPLELCDSVISLWIIFSCVRRQLSSLDEDWRISCSFGWRQFDTSLWTAATAQKKRQHKMDMWCL